MISFSHNAMDTEFSVSFGLNEDAELCGAAAAACFARIDEIEGLLSKFNDTSDVAVIGALKPGTNAIVARETMEVLVASARVCAATAGAFDPTVEARNFAQLILDVEHFRVGVKDEPVHLDFGGIGKGYALDECAKVLRDEQFDLHDWLIDGGTSTILVSGARSPEESSWPVGVGGVWKERTRLETVLHLSQGAISGSGFELRGEHVRDVRRGGAAVRWAQSWCKAPDATTADALTTAALALQPRELEAACQALDAQVLVARHQGKWRDRFRDPLIWFGGVPCGNGEVMV